MLKKFPKSIEPKKSKSSIPYDYFEALSIEPNKKIPTKEEMYKQLVKQMTNMTEKEIENMAHLIVNLILKLREK